MAIRIKVMTFNLRVRTIKDGINCFDARRDRIREVIESESPDVIGFQEASNGMLSWLKETFTDYVVLGHGREGDYHGEGTPIAYKRELFDLHFFDASWLSYTPQIPASFFNGVEQSRCPRMIIYAELIHRDATQPFVFCNVHTDHKSSSARVAECMAVMQRLYCARFPFVLTGDFNDQPDSQSIGMILGTKETLGTIDATENIIGSFHAFTGNVGDSKIDYIFTNLSADPTEAYAVPDIPVEGVYYSDHNALCAFLEL